MFRDVEKTVSEKGKPRVTGGHKATDPGCQDGWATEKQEPSSMMACFSRNVEQWRWTMQVKDAKKTLFTSLVITMLMLVFVPFVAADDAVILARQYVTNTVHIPGGHYILPYIVGSPNTEYVLDGDMTADGTAIAVRASKVVINLNGKTITYNQTIPGEGVTIDTYNKTDIAIINGSIIQGEAMSEGDQYGKGNNPVKTIGVSRLQVAGINARYGGRDVDGIFAQYAGTSIFESNTLEDTYSVGTLKNRMQGVDAIIAIGGNNVFRNNTIINCRQRGIQVGNYDEVYGNKITINSIATNSYGIFSYAKKHVKMYDNSIKGIGEHPIGIGAVSVGTDDIEIYNNTIETQTTRIGEEYGGSPSCFDSATPCGNYAVGFRTTWGGNNISFHDNTITVHTDSHYEGTYSPTGQSVVVDGKGRGLMVAINAGETSKFFNNTITTLDKDGTGKAFGIACTGNNDGDMTFEGNTVTSNILNVALSDEYGYCAAHPLFVKNTFVKSGNYPAYHTVAAELGGYYEGTGRFVSNVYQDGATESSLDMNFQKSGKNKSVLFGRLMEGTVRDYSNNLMPGIKVSTLNSKNVLESESTTDANGIAKFIVYDYELNNNNGTTESATPVLTTFRPHTLELYDTAISQPLFTTLPASSSSPWDSMSSAGSYVLSSEGKGSITINTVAATYIPPQLDTSAPSVSVMSPLSAAVVTGTVAVTVNATDNVAVTKVDLYVNGQAVSSAAIAPFTYNLDSTTLANGAHTIYAKAYDAAGNVGQSTNVTVYVLNDTTPPAATITTPSNGTTAGGVVTVNASASDDVGVTKVDFYVNNVLQASDAISPFSYNWNTGNVSDGDYQLSAKAYDAAGNVGQSSNVLVKVKNSVADTLAPTVTITTPTTGKNIGNVFTVSASATDNIGVTIMQVYFDNVLRFVTNLNNFTTRIGFNRLAKGSHVVLVKALDAAGNVGQKTVTVYR